MTILQHRITGLDAMRSRLKALPATARDAVDTTLSNLAEAVAGDVKATLAQSSAARAGASPPGGTPDDTAGRLADSVSVENDPGRARSTVSVSVPFALFLEFGTSRMAARPFLRPAALRAGRGAKALLAGALRRGLSP